MEIKIIESINKVQRKFKEDLENLGGIKIGDLYKIENNFCVLPKHSYYSKVLAVDRENREEAELKVEFWYCDSGLILGNILANSKYKYGRCNRIGRIEKEDLDKNIVMNTKKTLERIDLSLSPSCLINGLRIIGAVDNWIKDNGRLIDKLDNDSDLHLVNKIIYEV